MLERIDAGKEREVGWRHLFGDPHPGGGKLRPYVRRTGGRIFEYGRGLAAGPVARAVRGERPSDLGMRPRSRRWACGVPAVRGLPMTCVFPGSTAGSQLPHEGPRERVLPPLLDQAGAHRVVEDVQRRLAQVFLTADRSVVEAALPE